MKDLFFHTFEDGKLQYQAQVKELQPDGYVLAQMFSALDGEPTNLRLFHVHDLTDNKAKFYRTQEEWTTAYDKAIERENNNVSS